MKRALFFLMFALFCASIDAQNAKNDGKPYDVYCQVIIAYNSLANNVRSYKIVFNSEEGKVKLVDEKGKELNLKSIPDILNYMSKRGWTYVENTVYNQTESIILKKQVTKDDEIKENLNVKAD